MNLPVLAFKNLWYRKMRTSLTILGVGTSIAVFVSLAGSKDYFLVLGWDQNSSLFSKLKIQGQRPESDDEALVGSTISKKFNKKIGEAIEVKGFKLKE